MLNQIDAGAVVSYTNATGSDIASGDVVILGLMCGIAIVDIANTAAGNVSITGNYELTKKTATDVVALGDILVEDSGVKVITAGTTIVDGVIIGRATAASAATDANVDCKLGL